MTRLGVDFSQFGGPLAQETVRCWKEQGIEFAIPQYSSMLPQHLEALKQGSLDTEVYVYLYFPLSPWSQTPESRVSNCINMLHGFNVKRIWLDVEESNASPANTVAAVQRCVEVVQAAGLSPGIYTGRWIWPSATESSQAFAHLPLWHAEYTAPDGADESHPEDAPDFDNFIPYGGWTRPLIWQFQNTHPLCGHSVDLNAMEGSDMSQEQLNELGEQRARAYLIDALLRDFKVVPVAETADKLTVELQPLDGQAVMARFTIWKRPEVVRGE